MYFKRSLDCELWCIEMLYIEKEQWVDNHSNCLLYLLTCPKNIFDMRDEMAVVL